MATAPLALSPEVADALSDRRPVVALESTIITHGMPAPRNVETATAVEDEIRAEGAVPATIAVWGGQIRVGLGTADLEWLARQPAVAKLSRADLAIALATGQTGSTTVAATMIAARLAGIEVFATGGIGGVHRGAATTFDISADLGELAETQVTVVAAGPKAILDIALTLEVLETRGVPVIAFGQDELPAFWSRTSSHRAPARLDTPGEIAQAFRLRQSLGLPGGQLIANPIPAGDEIPAADLQPLIAQATAEAAAQGITGKAVTPFLLARILELTDGRSLLAKPGLVLNNARLAARIACALCTDGPGGPAIDRP